MVPGHPQALEHVGHHQLVVQLGRGAFQPAEHPRVRPEELQSPGEQHVALPEDQQVEVQAQPLAVLGGPVRLCRVHGLEEQGTGHRAEVRDVVATLEERVLLAVEVVVHPVEPVKALLHVVHGPARQQRGPVALEPVRAAQAVDDLQPALGVAPLVVAAHRPSQELADTRTREVQGVFWRVSLDTGIGISDGVHVAVRDSRASDGRESHEFREMHRTAVGGRERIAVPHPRVHACVYQHATGSIATIASVRSIMMHEQSVTEYQAAPGAHGVSVVAQRTMHARKRSAFCHAGTVTQAGTVRVVGAAALLHPQGERGPVGEGGVSSALVFRWGGDPQTPQCRGEPCASLIRSRPLSLRWRRRLLPLRRPPPPLRFHSE